MPLDPWIQIPKPQPQAQVRLFCFSYAGGSATVFRPWAAQLPAAIELCAIQLPGRDNRLREEPLAQFAPLLPLLVTALGPYLDRPFAFYGHSLGALLSYEVTRHLRRQQAPLPRQLFVAAHRAPHLPSAESPLHTLPPASFLAGVRQRYNGFASAIWENAELLELVLPQLRADFTLAETYRYQPEAPLACPIVAIGGQDDQSVPREELAQWRTHTQTNFKLYLLPGDHFFLKQASAELLTLLRTELLQLLHSRQ